MKIGILQTGRALDELITRHGDFDSLFMTLLADQDFGFQSYAVHDNQFPTSPKSCDGWLITGSRHSSYDDYPWIARLEIFLRDAYDADVPIVGICFGHQILARALGGTVEKSQKGWGLGPHEYKFDGITEPVTINAWHQDQVTSLPKEGVTVGRSDFCEHAAIVYGTRAYTVQAHPEFNNDFITDLIEMRRGSVPADRVQVAEKNLKATKPSSQVAAQIVSFFKTRSLAIQDINT